VAACVLFHRVIATLFHHNMRHTTSLCVSNRTPHPRAPLPILPYIHLSTMPQGMLPLEQSLEQFRRNHPNPKSHRPQRITKPLRDIYTRNFTREHETTPAERGAASEELLQELEFVPVSSTPAVLSRKEEFEKEVATAREELRMKRMEKKRSTCTQWF
jgi:hypothetical protein